MSALRFASWRFTLVLVSALAACSDDALTTAPADDPSVTTATPSFTLGRMAATFARFTRIGALPRATATASALPYSGEFCTQSQAKSGQWYLQLTARQIAALEGYLALGATATVNWDTYTQFHFGGYKNVRHGATLSNGIGQILYEESWEQNVDPLIDGAGTGEVTEMWHNLTPADAAALTAGGSLTVSLWGVALAWVHEDVCGQQVAGAQALWRTGSEPKIWIDL